MKVSIDGILSTARRMKEQKQIEDEPLKNHKKGEISDSIEIRTKLNSRLITIQKELNEIQSSLTKNQIIKEGINQLLYNNNDEIDQKRLMNELTFKDENVLSQFIGNDTNKENLIKKSDIINNLIDADITSLKHLQVEVENILASSITSSDHKSKINEIELTINQIDKNTLQNISTLKPEMVMNLIN